MRHHYPVEVMGRPCHRIFDVHETSQIGEVRRAAVAIAESLGFDETASGRVALVATELGTNLVRHASKGRMLVAAVENDIGEIVVELLSIDAGPGIACIPSCMADGYSTGGTPGTGLGAIRRLSDEFDVYSAQPTGTVILSRVGSKPNLGAAPTAAAPNREFSVAAVALAAPREVVCGDGWSVVQDGRRAAIFMADGLGHGPYAAEAAMAAVAVFENAAFLGPSAVLEKVHGALRATRGAAIALAEIDRDKNSVLFSGAGNIAGRLISGVEDRSLLSQHGTAGMQIPQLKDVQYDLPLHSILVMHSDGLTTRWKLKDASDILQHHPAVIAAWLIRDHCRGSDDVSVVIIKGKKSS